MLDFKLNLYYEILKDKSFTNSEEFRRYFQRHYGNFQYINELIVKINKYQIKKYGQSMIYYSDFNTKEDLKKMRLKYQRQERIRKQRIRNNDNF